jgi:hypothetical protein
MVFIMQGRINDPDALGSMEKRPPGKILFRRP